jgi:ubiquitin C-terminal hydrolase
MFLTRHYRYDLYATVNHMGSIDGGHYIAYMQVQYGVSRFPSCSLLQPWGLLIFGPQMGSSWYCGDDSRVSPKSAPPIDPSSYILFYRRTTSSS